MLSALASVKVAHNPASDSTRIPKKSSRVFRIMESFHKSAISDAQAAIIRSVVLASPSPASNEHLPGVIGDSDPFVADGDNDNFLRERAERWESREPIDDDDGLRKTEARPET